MNKIDIGFIILFLVLAFISAAGAENPFDLSWFAVGWACSHVACILTDSIHNRQE